jgi:hypothetical protein
MLVDFTKNGISAAQTRFNLVTRLRILLLANGRCWKCLMLALYFPPPALIMVVRGAKDGAYVRRKSYQLPALAEKSTHWEAP